MPGFAHQTPATIRFQDGQQRVGISAEVDQGAGTIVEKAGGS
jgi:hypothetical protein